MLADQQVMALAQVRQGEVNGTPDSGYLQEREASVTPNPTPNTATRRVRPWLLVSLAWLVPAILGALQVMVRYRLEKWDGDIRQIAAFEFIDWFLYAALTPVVFYLGGRWPLRRGHLLRRIPIHFLGAWLTCAAWAAAGTLLRWFIFRDPGILSNSSYIGWFFTSLPFGFAVYFAVLGIEHATFYFRQARERETQAARLSAQLAEARLGALRMQMNPHFLLNSLNAVLVLVRDRDHVTATRVLEELGEVLRHVLRSGGAQEVALEEELDFVRRYLGIEQVRFSDRLRVNYRVDTGIARAAVPDFILQPLVENALRHGIATRPEGGTITVAARREGAYLILSVEDDGPGFRDVPRGSAGLGLTNTRERLQVLYGERGQLEVAASPSGGTVARVHIPYREMGERERSSDG